MLNTNIKLLTAGLLSFACTASYADCRQLFIKQQHGYVAQQLVAPVVYYQAGRDIEADALAEKVAKLAASKLMQQLATMQPAQLTGKQQQVASAGAFQKCAQCHSGANPKAGLTLDGSTPVPCQTLWRWLEISMHGKDVPRAMDGLVKQMTPEEKGALTDAMLKMGSLEAQNVRPESVPPDPGIR